MSELTPLAELAHRMQTCQQCGRAIRWWQISHYIADGVMIHRDCLPAFARQMYRKARAYFDECLGKIV